MKNGTVELTLKSEVFDNFRCKMAADSLDIDTEKKSIHHIKVENIKLPEKWNIGLFYGNSGSGKTTLAKHLFGEDCFKSIIDENQPIINQFPKSLTYEQCAELLNGIGLNSVPCWIRPVKTLSNGQRARAEAALLMCQNLPEIKTDTDDFIVMIDEWTSVVDRTVAKAMSICLSKFARKQNRKIILCSCHIDILEWLVPDWMIDCNEQQFKLKQGEDFFFQKREQITFQIKKIGRESWKYFSKYHYLSDRLPGGRIHLFGLFIDNIQIGFQCFANYTPIRKGELEIQHSNRTVVHPDYTGLGLGIKLINVTSQWMVENENVRVMAKFSAIPVFKAMSKQACWKYLGTKRLMGKMQVGGSMDRSAGFREGGVKTFHFEYIDTRTLKR